VDIDTPAGIEAMDWYVSLYTDHQVTQPTALTDRFPEMFAQFQGDVVGMLMHALHSWREQYDVLGDRLGVVAIPEGPAGRGARLSLGGSVILNSTEHPDEAWTLMSFLSAPDQAKVMSDIRGNLPAFTSLQDDPLYDNPFYQAAFASSPYLREVPSWHPGWSILSDTYGPELQRLMRQEVTTEEFCTSLANAMREA
jgi:multiple sugar transport system substrate-binding protein